MKKLLALLMVVAMLCLLCACTETPTEEETSKPAESDVFMAESTITLPDSVDYSNIKVGLICLHDENSTYDNNFIQALKDTQTKLGLKDDQVLIKTNIEEGSACYDTACELVDEGCNIIFADSFGHESYMIQAAEKYPEVQFCHATGTQSQVKKLANYHNAFASIYEGRFLAGVVAGMKLNEMIDSGKIKAEEAVIGYVGAYNYAEVKSGFTSFFLGARYICKSATMKVVYTNSWFDIAKEKESALSLINDGCVLISQHADSEGAPKACEEKGVPNVAYNVNTASIAPTTALVSSKINWSPYYEYAIANTAAGKAFATDWCGTIATGSVELTELNEAAVAPGTAEKVEEVKKLFSEGKLDVFDTSTWTVDGKQLTEYQADVNDQGDFAPDTNVINEGAFTESYNRSAPYFDIIIDGITEK